MPTPLEECSAGTQSMILFRTADFMNVDACLKEALKREEAKDVLTNAKTCSTL